MEQVVINKEVWSYLAMPVEVTLVVDFERSGSEVTVHSWVEEMCPFDSPSQVWWETLEEHIDNYFFELGLNATFNK